MAVFNDGDLEVAYEEDTVVHKNYEENKKINNESAESEDEFIINTPQKDALQKSCKDRYNLQTPMSLESGCSVNLLANPDSDSFSVNLKPGDTPTKYSYVLLGLISTSSLIFSVAFQ